MILKTNRDPKQPMNTNYILVFEDDETIDHRLFVIAACAAELEGWLEKRWYPELEDDDRVKRLQLCLAEIKEQVRMAGSILGEAEEPESEQEGI